MSTHIEVVDGDLLDQPVEAIVNAWNRNFIPWWLLLPQGVSGAIKKRGGYAPFRELAGAGILRAGDAVVTAAGRLPFRAIIHVAALDTFWRSAPQIVRTCVGNALRLATQNDYRSIALPLIGSGTGGLSTAVVEALLLDEIDRSDYTGRIVVVRFRGGKRAPSDAE